MLPLYSVVSKPQMRIGIDLAQVSRFERLIQNRAFVERVFHPSEIRDSRPEHLAGVFAAKEAFFKALGLSPRWLDLEVAEERDGKPSVKAAAGLGLDGLLTFDVSIAHEGDYAVAVVVILFETEEER